MPEEKEGTARPVNPGAEQWLEKPIPCLDHGFVRLVDYMGNDAAIVQAARVSYGAGTKKVSEDRGLVRYLLRNVHTTPFEMCELKFHCKMPIFVARQWIRHRTANVNEYSARYSEVKDEFYLPDPDVLKKQSSENRQGRGEELTDEQKRRVLYLLRADYAQEYSTYEQLLGEIELARELARIGLSVAAYTQWYWKIDLHNLFHFLRLRLDSHAQYEIRVFAEAMARIVKDAFPVAWEAFEDYRLKAVSFSRLEIEVLKTRQWAQYGAEDSLKEFLCARFGNKREAEEFIVKLKKIGYL